MTAQKNRSILFLTTLLVSVSVRAQQFSEKAIFGTVSQTGFYAINITPELSAYAGKDFSDLRIVNEKGQFMAYLIRSKTPQFYGNTYNEFPILKNEVTDSGKSIIVIENKNQEKLFDIAVWIRNAAVSRKADISGSDDMIKWYTVAEGLDLEKKVVTENDKYIQTIEFPVSSYRYFKIIIENGKNNPLNIIEARRYIETQHKYDNSYLLNPAVNFIQIDSSNHNSYIKVHQNAPYHIDKVTIKINGPKFFSRKAEIVLRNAISDFQISSDSSFVFYVPTFNDMDWYIKINNGDNSPLRITNIITEQESKQIVTFLEGGKNYHLLMNNSLATRPVYDLQQFKDSISVNIPDLHILSIQKINDKAQITSSNIFEKWLWPLIIIVILVLAIFTFYLSKEVERKK
jgi:hypothetical protein